MGEPLRDDDDRPPVARERHALRDGAEEEPGAEPHEEPLPHPCSAGHCRVVSDSHTGNLLAKGLGTLKAFAGITPYQ